MSVLIRINQKIDIETLEKAMNFTLPKPNLVMSYLNDNGIAIVCFANHLKNIDIELTIVGFGKWANRTMLKHVFNFIFNELKCGRCTVSVKLDNTKSLKMVDKLGFKKEGYLRVIDANIYSLLKSECKYL